MDRLSSLARVPKAKALDGLKKAARAAQGSFRKSGDSKSWAASVSAMGPPSDIDDEHVYSASEDDIYDDEEEEEEEEEKEEEEDDDEEVLVVVDEEDEAAVMVLESDYNDLYAEEYLGRDDDFSPTAGARLPVPAAGAEGEEDKKEEEKKEERTPPLVANRPDGGRSTGYGPRLIHFPGVKAANHFMQNVQRLRDERRARNNGEGSSSSSTAPAPTLHRGLDVPSVLAAYNAQLTAYNEGRLRKKGYTKIEEEDKSDE